MLAVCVPAPVTRLPGSASGTCFAGPHSPWPPPFAPPTPRRIAPLCSPASQLLWRGPTSRVRASSATAPRLPDADRHTRHNARDGNGQTRDLPGSDTIPLHVIWPLTPAGRQHLAWRCRTCCLRANKDSRPPRYRSFVAQSHTPCNRCVRFASTVASGHATLTTKRALPLTWAGFHRLDRASFAWRLHSFDHLVGAGEQGGRNFKAEGLRCRQINDEIELGRLLDWQVSRLSPAQNLVDKIGSAPELAWPILIHRTSGLPLRRTPGQCA